MIRIFSVSQLSVHPLPNINLDKREDPTRYFEEQKPQSSLLCNFPPCCLTSAKIRSSGPDLEVNSQ